MGVKISQLPSLASAKVTSNDLLPIVNQTDQGTHNITVGSLRTVIENNLSAVAQTTATTTKLGSVIVGNGLAITAGGILSLAQGTTGGTISNLGPSTVSSSTNPGQPGQVTWDGSYFYMCVDINTWIRIPITPADVPGAW